MPSNPARQTFAAAASAFRDRVFARLVDMYFAWGKGKMKAADLRNVTNATKTTAVAARKRRD
jgi:hypothetical protein